MLQSSLRVLGNGVSDPMSGFFALKRSTYDRAERLTPLGYKIALELMCKCRVQHVREVPIHFGLRTKGESKMSRSIVLEAFWRVGWWGARSMRMCAAATGR